MQRNTLAQLQQQQQQRQQRHSVAGLENDDWLNKRLSKILEMHETKFNRLNATQHNATRLDSSSVWCRQGDRQRITGTRRRRWCWGLIKSAFYFPVALVCVHKCMCRWMDGCAQRVQWMDALWKQLSRINECEVKIYLCKMYDRADCKCSKMHMCLSNNKEYGMTPCEMCNHKQERIMQNKTKRRRKQQQQQLHTYISKMRSNRTAM